MTENSRRKS